MADISRHYLKMIQRTFAMDTRRVKLSHNTINRVSLAIS